VTATIDGPQSLLSVLRAIADNEDVLNAQMGVGIVLRTGIVQSSLPTVTIAMDGESSMGGPMIFDHAKGDLLLPEDSMLTAGDTVVMAPLSKRRWVVLFKTRRGGETSYRARFGLNNDRSGGEFAGMEVIQDPATGLVTINLVGGTTNVTGGITNVEGGITNVGGGEVTNITGDHVLVNGGAPGGGAHEEFVPANGATDLTLSQSASLLYIVSRSGIIQSADDGHYSLGPPQNKKITFTDAFNGTERVVVVYARAA
jgi:hypothetical protein